MSKGYWAKRALQRMDEYHRDADRVIVKVLEAYQDSIADINEEMQKIFNTYSKNSKLSPEEAKQYLTNIESKEYLNRLKERIKTITDEDLKTELLSRINAPAYRARLTRFQALKEKLNIECKRLADVQIREMEQGLFNTAEKAYYSTIFDIQRRTGLGFSFAEIPTKQIEEILKNPWSGKHFSKRIWGNTDKLAVELEHTLTKGFMSGASIQKMSKEIADTMQVGEFAATRLIRTETTYVANMAELAAYKEAGVEKLMFLATLDSRTSDICRSNDGNMVLVEKAVPGENIPPLHPNCRSTTIEVFEDDDLSKLKRRARAPETGKNKTIPANITYKEWYEENVANNPKAQAEEKKFKNRASDKKQFERYKEILGNKVPKSFDMFQELKYNNANQWKKLEQLYSDTKSGKVWLSADFSSEKKFNMHVEKHLKEYGDITKEEYLNIARELLASPVKGDIERFKSKLGFVFRYNKATNDFALGRADGKISTLFKPKDGYKYWVEQVEKYKEE